MSVKVAQLDGIRLSMPLRSSFGTADTSIEVRDICLIRASGGGQEGWGEAAPFPGQDESMDELLASTGSDDPTPTLLAAIDEALADLSARAQGRPLLPPRSGSVPLCVAVGIEDAMAAVDRHVEAGIMRFKVKIGPARIGHVRAIRAKHPDVLIAVDGNGSFGAGRMAELESLSSVGVALAEELFDEWQSHEVLQFGERTGIPLFADESVRSLADVQRLLALPGVDGITIKPGRLGWGGALTARDLAMAAGKRWRASGLLETGMGRSFSNLLASQDGADMSDVADARMFFVDDVVRVPVESGSIVLPKGEGIGVTPHSDVVDRYRVGEFDLGTWTLSNR